MERLEKEESREEAAREANERENSERADAGGATPVALTPSAPSAKSDPGASDSDLPAWAATAVDPSLLVQLTPPRDASLIKREIMKLVQELIALDKDSKETDNLMQITR